MFTRRMGSSPIDRTIEIQAQTVVWAFLVSFDFTRRIPNEKNFAAALPGSFVVLACWADAGKMHRRVPDTTGNRTLFHVEPGIDGVV